MKQLFSIHNLPYWAVGLLELFFFEMAYLNLMEDNFDIHRDMWVCILLVFMLAYLMIPAFIIRWLNRKRIMKPWLSNASAIGGIVAAGFLLIDIATVITEDRYPDERAQIFYILNASFIGWTCLINFVLGVYSLFAIPFRWEIGPRPLGSDKKHTESECPTEQLELTHTNNQ